jgi:hypothetical protein
MDGPGAAIRLVGSHEGSADPKSVKPGVRTGERMPTVSGIEIVGNHDQASHRGGARCHDPLRDLIRTCRLGVHLVSGPEPPDRRRPTSTRGGGRGAIGVFFDDVDLHQAIIVGTHISYHRHAGIKVRGGQIRNLQITGCDIEYNYDPESPTAADVWIDAREGMVREVTIASNTIQAKESPGGGQLRIEGADLEASSARRALDDRRQPPEPAINLLLRSLPGRRRDGQLVRLGYERSIVVDRCRQVVMTGNSLDHNPDYRASGSTGILIRTSSGVMISGHGHGRHPRRGPRDGGAIEVVDSSEVRSRLPGARPGPSRDRLRGVRHTQVSGCTVLDRRDRLDARGDPPGRPRAGNLVQGNLAGGPLVVAEGTVASGNVEVGSAPIR